jgi:uncharacterized protein RhaS with RHS repeats
MAETGLNQNYNRDYDPAVGRYIESDPIGLYGGSLSTYAYGQNNPIGNVDPSGLQSIAACANPVNAAVCAEAGITVGSGASSSAAVTASAAAATAAAAASSGDSSNPSNVIPFPVPKTADNPNNCPDDGCERDQKVLLGQRLLLTNMLAARTVSIADYAQKATVFNQSVTTHNARCPKNKVAPLPLGPRGV